MSVIINKEIKYCDECDFAYVSKVYTPDSWDDITKIKCSKLDKDVHTYLEYNDKAEIPVICPLNKKE